MNYQTNQASPATPTSFEAPRRQMMKHLQYLVMVALLLLLAACGQTQAPEAAPTEEMPPVEEAAPGEETEPQLTAASPYSYILGSAFYTNSSYPPVGLPVFLQYWNGSQWIDLGQKGKTGNNGTVLINGMPFGYWYRLYVYKMHWQPVCRAVVQGMSSPFQHNSTQNRKIPVTIERLGGNCLF